MNLFFFLEYSHLLLYGVHVGHSLQNTLTHASWFVIGFRQKLSIINLFKTFYNLRLSLIVFSNVVLYQGPIWFINLDTSMNRYVKMSSFNCGEFPVTSNWIRGSISNYFSVFNTFRRNMQINGSALPQKYLRYRKGIFSNWFLTRFSWPRAAFVSNVSKSYLPSIECFSLRIPGVGVVDTNTYGQCISLPIPGNDESVPSIIFYNDFISNFILVKKYSKVASWFFNVRASKRTMDFISWIKLDSLNSNALPTDLFNTVTFASNSIQNITQGFALRVSQSFWRDTFYEKLDFFIPENLKTDAFALFFSLVKTKSRTLAYINYTFFSNFWRSTRLYKSRFLTESNFRLHFLKPYFFKKKFIPKKTYKNRYIFFKRIRKGFFRSTFWFKQRGLNAIYKEPFFVNRRYLFSSNLNYPSYPFFFKRLLGIFKKKSNTQKIISTSKAITKHSTKINYAKLNSFIAVRAADFHFYNKYMKFFNLVPRVTDYLFYDLSFFSLFTKPFFKPFYKKLTFYNSILDFNNTNFRVISNFIKPLYVPLKKRIKDLTFYKASINYKQKLKFFVNTIFFDSNVPTRFIYKNYNFFYNYSLYNAPDIFTYYFRKLPKRRVLKGSTNLLQYNYKKILKRNNDSLLFLWN